MSVLMHFLFERSKCVNGFGYEHEVKKIGRPIMHSKELRLRLNSITAYSHVLLLN